MSKDALVEQYVRRAGNTEAGLNSYTHKIATRDAQEQTARIVDLTRQMRNMTVIITVLTALNALLVLAAL